jgi:hypothetical protein
MVLDTKRCPQNAKQYTGTRRRERERETPPPAGTLGATRYAASRHGQSSEIPWPATGAG